MAEAGIIRKKIAAQRVERAEGGPGADRGWRVAMARAVQDQLKLSLDVRSLSIERRSLAELAELIPERALIAILEGPGDGLGAIVISQPVLSGLIEAQTIGRLRNQEVVPRKPTRTDAAMVAGMIDAALTGLEEQLAEEADLVWAGGFRYASFLDDPRPLVLLLEDAPMKLLRAEVSLAGGIRQGPLLLAVPAEGRGRRPSAAEPSTTPEDHGPAFSTALAEKVMGSQARVDAILSKITLSLASVMQLEVGAVLPLGEAALDRIHLEGLDGRRVGEGKLGQNRGLRAVRLSDAVSGVKTATGEMEAGPELGRAAAFGMAAGLADGGEDPFAANAMDGFPAMSADLGAELGANLGAEVGLDGEGDFPAMDFPAMGAGDMSEFLANGTE